MLAYKFSLDRNCRIAEWRKILKTKLTVVVDNISNKGILGEWGLSIYVEYSDKKILLDAGASNLFLDNMKSLGIDVSDIDFASLSHAHYDHANGFPAFLDNNTKAKLFLRGSTAVDCYKKVFIFHKYIGIPKNLMKDYSDRIQIVSDDYKVMDGVYLIPHKTENLVEIGRREKMFRKTSNGWRPDDFSHEHLGFTIPAELNDGEEVYLNLWPVELNKLIETLNITRARYEQAVQALKKDYWWQMIQLLPTSYNQRRTIDLNYEVLASQYRQRKEHKLDEWHQYCDWIKTLPYSEFITMEESDA